MERLAKNELRELGRDVGEQAARTLAERFVAWVRARVRARRARRERGRQ